MDSLLKIDFYFNCKTRLSDSFVVKRIDKEKMDRANCKHQMTSVKLPFLMRSYEIEF